jgi:hypothetical protein
MELSVTQDLIWSLRLRPPILFKGDSSPNLSFGFEKITVIRYFLIEEKKWE